MVEDREDYTEGTYIFDALDVWGKYQQIGLTELAVRLGSIVRYRRTGSVIWLDAMEFTPMRWSTYKESASCSIGYSNEAAESGGQSIKIRSANIIGKYCHITKYIPIVPTGKAGYEVSVSLGSGTYGFYMWYEIADGTNVYVFGLKYDTDTHKVYVYEHSEVWTEVETLTRLWTNVTLFHNFKMIIDVDNLLYVKAYIDTAEIDLSSYTPSHYELAYGKWIAAKTGMYSKQTTQRNVYIDNVILTEME